jgi:mannose-1-phosphate guanylyltransferase
MVERCRQAGVTDILINVHYQAQQIETFFGDGQAFGVQIRYVREDTPLDTAGSMKLAEPFYTGAPLVVFNADILTDLDLPRLFQTHRQSKAKATLALVRVANPMAFGLVELSPDKPDAGAGPNAESARQVLAFREKPTAEQVQQLQIDTINAGTYVLEPEIFAQYPTGTPLSFERTVFPNLLAQGQRVSALVWDGYWQDLGTPGKYYQSQLDILTGQMPYMLPELGNEVAPQVWAATTAQIDPAAKLVGPSYIGENSKLGPHAQLPAGTILGANCLIDQALTPGMYGPTTVAVHPG